MASNLIGGVLDPSVAEELGVDSVQVFREELEARGQVEYTVFFRDPKTNSKHRFDFLVPAGWFNDPELSSEDLEQSLLLRVKNEIRVILSDVQ